MRKLEKKRFIVLVLDGFGIGAMRDTKEIRPSDINADTFGSILKDYPELSLPNLEKLGLMNAYGRESAGMKYSPLANFGKAELKHFGADTFMGHQELMGTLPKKPEAQPFQENADSVAAHLKEHGHKAEFITREKLRYILCDDYVTVADNLEADLGMCYNVTAPLDFIPFEKELRIAELVREAVTVGRVVVFGGTGNTMKDLWDAEEIKQEKYIGIASARSKSYEQGYQCRHLGYGVDRQVQTPTILTKAGIPVTLIGKVADIVINDSGKSIFAVSTKECLKLTEQALVDMTAGFICTNIQETDLAGHSQSTKDYKEILKMADEGIGRILSMLEEQDILLIMADHGNDPLIGHSRHTREYVPLLLYKKGVRGRKLGTRNTLSDVGASVCGYFRTGLPQSGSSFLDMIN